MPIREQLGSRLGFVFLSAACAIGLGNIWRFPYLVGKHGGAVFVIIYLIALVLLGLPLLIMELAIGRASRRTLAGAYDVLKDPKSRFNWGRYGKIFFTGNVILMMFYTTVTGWLIAYFFHYLTGSLAGRLPGPQVNSFFTELTASPSANIIFMALTVILASVICVMGLRRGVERLTKIIMFFLFVMIFILCAKSLTLPGTSAALKFYLAPNFDCLKYPQITETIYAAVGQAFFTLSVGVGSIALFGSYSAKKQSLTTDGLWIAGLDTIVALTAGLIVFPICFSYSGNPAEGPGLIFMTLPNMFNSMFAGRWWGAAFFFFMLIAALSTVIAVFENLIAYFIDQHGFSRHKASWWVGVGVFFLSLPCALGFNVLKGIQPLGSGSNILDLEDFVFSQNILPLGALYIVIFCFYGWGWKNFFTEANTGSGLRFPSIWKNYLQYILPAIFLLIFIIGYYAKIKGMISI